MRHVGRSAEIKRIREILSGAESGRIAIIGERGIGKSHLLEEVKKIAVEELKHAVAYASIDPSLTPNILAARLMLSLNTEGAVGKLASLWNRLKDSKSFSFAGFALTPGGPNVAHGALEEFCFLLIKAFKENEEEKGKGKAASISKELNTEGATLIIDEVDAANNDILPIGACLKMIVEYLDFHKVKNVNLVIAGLPGMRQTIYSTHPSAWREFENVELSPLTEDDSRELILELLRPKSDSGKQVPQKEVEKILRPDALKEIVALAGGYPHWIRELTLAAKRTAEGSLPITRHHLSKGKPAAFQRVWENYYSNDFENLKPEAKDLLRLIAIHARDDVRLDLLEKVSGRGKADFAELLNGLQRANIIHVKEVGIYRYAAMRSIAYRHKLSQILHPLLDPLQLSEFWNDADRLLSGLKIFGEKGAPTFKAFCKLVGGQFDSENNVEFFEYDSKNNLFDTLQKHALVAEFRNWCDANLESGSPDAGPFAEESDASQDGDGGANAVVARTSVPISDSRDERPVLLTTLGPDERFSAVWNEADLLCIPCKPSRNSYHLES